MKEVSRTSRFTNNLLTNISREQLVNTLDLSYLEGVLTRSKEMDLLANTEAGRDKRLGIVEKGYPGSDTSVGWFNYDDEAVRQNCKKALTEGLRRRIQRKSMDRHRKL